MGFFSKDIATMDDLFVHTLKDIYYAENQIVKALPDMIEKASDAQLKQGFQSHLAETKNHVKRLEQVFKMHGVEVEGVDCPAIDGIIKETKDIIGEVDDKRVLTDGKRTIEIIRFDNPHVDGMLLSYIADARLGFVVDVWSPGRDKLGDKITPPQAAVVAAVKRLSSVPERLAGGHGSFADYAPLAALAVASAH